MRMGGVKKIRENDGCPWKMTHQTAQEEVPDLVFLQMNNVFLKYDFLFSVEIWTGESMFTGYL